MKFPKLHLEEVLRELAELPSNWIDEKGRALVDEIRRSVEGLRKLKVKPTATVLEAALAENAAFLDVCRLFLGKGQEPVAHMLCDQLGESSMTWSRLRGLAAQDPARMAQALVGIGLPDLITDHMDRRWEVEDVLIDRYKMTRGRAIAGQKRGRALEDDVEKVLRENGVPFETRVSFVGKDGKTAKCDFAIPTANHPKVVIEAKGFEATGSKLTDYLGDVLKVAEAKEYHMYFFLVTDGRGWHNRRSDLQKLVAQQNSGVIDMIYTRARLRQLAHDVKHIHENE